MASVVTKTVTAAASAASPSSTLRVVPQGGILEGANPSVYDAKNPIILFIIQAGIIIIFCRLLHYPLSKLRQPRVIAEVIGGIILGPSVMMRIPGFQKAIFPTASMAGLSLVANLGLILFLFLVGLEVNLRMFLSNWRIALSVGLAGMLLPFGLGSAIAWGLYHEFHNDGNTVQISFGVYMLFIGTALSITAFPVLCRILTELKLLSTPVGVTVLAAGVGNDVIGWILLALCVALVNNGSGISALYVLLSCIAWIVFLVYFIRPGFLWVLRRSGSIQNGPTQGMMALTMLLVLTSSWFTQIIGVHAIFGAFLVGLICPHDGGFAIKVTEKVEDLVSVLLLPLYFALSGLSTNLGLLNNGITWAYVIGVIAVAFAGKIIGGTLAARANKLMWRESLTIGSLMSCKGLVELIVLNIGLQAKILSTKTFTIFVVMALVTTVATTPLVTYLYPPHYQRKLESYKAGEIDWEGNRLVSEDGSSSAAQPSLEKLQSSPIRRVLVYLRLDSLPSLFTFISLMSGDTDDKVRVHKAKQLASVPEDTTDAATSKLVATLSVHGLRILEITERASSVMRGSELEDDSYRDPVVNAFRTFAQLNNLAASGGVSIVPESSYAETVTSKASDHSSDLVLIPWSDDSQTTSEGDTAPDSLSSSNQDALVQKILENATCTTAIFVNHRFGGEPTPEAATRPGVSSISLRSRLSHPSRHERTPATPLSFDRSHHIFFPFLGGVDDRVALRFVLQLAQNSIITVTITHFNTPIQSSQQKLSAISTGSSVIPPNRSGSNLNIENVDTETMYASAKADQSLIHTLRDSLPAALSRRVVFSEVATAYPITDAVAHARQEVGLSQNAGDLIVVGRGRHCKLAENAEYTGIPLNPELKKTLGVLAEAIVSGGVRGSVLVLQAGQRDVEC